ncbi:MAG: response regulator [Gammaproteobacteria bacterium]
MTDFTVNPDDENPDLNSYIDEHNFSTASFIQNDLLTSLVSFCLIILFPMLVWAQIDHKQIFIWQGVMISILAIRWYCGLSFANAATTESSTSHWDTIIISLILLEGLGWGAAGAFLFPIDSVLTMSLIALLSIGVGGIGSVSYATNILVAVPFLVCTTLPYITRLFSIGGENEFLIASSVGVVSMMFYFSTFRLNNTLNTAFDIDTEDEITIINLEDQNLLLKKNIRREKNKFKNLKDQLSIKINQEEETDRIITELSEKLYRLAGTALNVVNDLGLLKESKATKKQKKLISSMEDNVHHIADVLDNITIGGSEYSHLDVENKKKEINQQIKGNILIVNDQNNEVNIIEKCIHKTGWNCVSVSDIPSALDALCDAESRKEYFDIIISTINLPAIDGLGFAEGLQDDPAFKNIQFILTGSSENIDREKLNNLNIHHIFVKPINEEKLTFKITQLIKKSVKNLPASIQTLVDDSVEISTSSLQRGKLPVIYTSVIDAYVIDGLRSLSPTNFSSIVNNYIEDAARLIEEANLAYEAKKYSDLNVTVKDLGSRSLHVGAIGLMEHLNTITDAINNKKYTSIPNIFHSINTELIQVESALLAELTDGPLIRNEHKH